MCKWFEICPDYNEYRCSLSSIKGKSLGWERTRCNDDRVINREKCIPLLLEVNHDYKCPNISTAERKKLMRKIYGD